MERQCTSQEDFEVFFNELLDPPTAFADGSPIEVLDDPEILELAKKGQADEKLKAEINEVWKTLRSRPKGPRATEHDAALTMVAEGLHRSGQRCTVLTLDKTMHEHALHRAGHNNYPLWVSLDALIQVLAVDGSGPNVDPTAFAPLMSSIIRHQCEPVLNTYTAEDLGLILDVEDRCAKLPPDEVRKIAGLVARSRLSGKRQDDPELQLQVRRAFQRGRLEFQEDLQEQLQISSVAIRDRDQQIAEEAKKHVTARAAFVTTRVREIRRKAFWVTAAATGFVVLLAGGLAYAGYWAAAKIVSPGKTAEFITFLLTCLSAATYVLAQIWTRILPKWKQRVENAASVAESELDSQHQ